MDALGEPEMAICAFEQVHGVLVTLYDFAGRFMPHLAIRRDVHRHAVCQSFKERDRNAMCSQYESNGVAQFRLVNPGGWIQRCPVGLGEAVVPLRMGADVAGILFAGPFRSRGQIGWARDAGLDDPPGPRPRLSDEEAGRLLECLRQLADRLAVWAAGVHPRAGLSRRAIIMQYLSKSFASAVSLDDIASELGLSRFHAARTIRRTCGAPFRSLLTDVRLDRAAALLRYSESHVTEVALAVGFNDVSHFHRVFRHRYGTTPNAWRVQGIA